MTAQQIKPYLLMSMRDYLFQEAAMAYLGITETPKLFEKPPAKPFYLGHACQGEQIPHCLKFFQGFYKDFTAANLEQQICIPKCRRATHAKT